MITRVGKKKGVSDDFTYDHPARYSAPSMYSTLSVYSAMQLDTIRQY